ncbi:MAG: DUF1460 domain-containing protein [Bdellovibrionales bacterium]|nr:DUF1460 domain-containing protein [Bdellovibrionales bacterium]
MPETTRKIHFPLNALFFLTALGLTAWATGAHAQSPAPTTPSTPTTVVTPTDHLYQLTSQWLGLPYGIGPLGEGDGGNYDQDPLYRFDQFDCVTFVETAIASVTTTDFAAFEKKMNQIRYENGKVDFVSRNHFSEVDWLPNNLQNGTLYEVIGQAEKKASKPFPYAVATIDKKNWYAKMTLATLKVAGLTDRQKRKRLKDLQSEGKKMPAEVSRLPYIPTEEFFGTDGSFKSDVIDGLPNVMVLSVIRPGWDLKAAIGTEMNISHQGFLLKMGSKWVVRHATNDSRNRVVEDSLEDFLKKFIGSPTIRGIHIVGVTGL